MASQDKIIPPAESIEQRARDIAMGYMQESGDRFPRSMQDMEDGYPSFSIDTLRNLSQLLDARLGELDELSEENTRAQASSPIHTEHPEIHRLKALLGKEKTLIERAFQTRENTK